MHLKLAVKFLAVVFFVFLALFLWLQPTSTMQILWNIGQEIIMEKNQKEDKQAIVHITRQDGTSLKLPIETYLEGVIGLSLIHI